nr:probable glutamate receptor [Parasteatoda tepidariorum]
MRKLPDELTVATVQTPELEFKEINGEIFLSGVDGKFLESLMAAFNVRFRMKEASDGEWGSLLDNGNWSGMVGMVHRGEADIAINQISITEERLSVVDFSIPYTDEIVPFVAPAPKRISSLIVYLYPFDITVWVLCAITLITLPLMYVLLINQTQTYDAVFIKVFGYLLRQPAADKKKSFAHRVFILVCLVFSLVISSSYCAVLLSFLSVPLYESKLRNFKELSEAVIQGRHTAQLFSGTFILHLLLTSADENMKTMGEIIQWNSWTFPVSAFNDGSLDREKVTISTIADLQALYKGYSNVILSEDSLLTTSICVVFRKDFCCKEMFDTAISRIISAGLYEKFKSEESVSQFESINANDKIQREVPHHRITKMEAATLHRVV